MVWNRIRRGSNDPEQARPEPPLESAPEPGSAGEEAPSYDELRAGFTAVVSHELRTPLARLLSLIETATLPGAELGGFLEEMRGEVEQMRELVDEILFLSELETGREIVALTPTRALPVLQDALAGLAEAAERAGVRLSAQGDPGLELPLRPRMLKAVAENFAENAIRYAGEGAAFMLSVEREAEWLVLRAEDDGVGVDEGDLPRLFERFYRADRARASRGTGLGLAIVKHIVTSADGQIEARGGGGRGLQIRCVFPAG
jgi:signal transduction histidine kinase